jgi:uncharacterized SAM-binding protein YcdF (DUF218 family)
MEIDSMYFVASKIVWAFLHPSTLLISATLIGITLANSPLAVLGRRLAAVVGGALAIFALTPISVALIRPLEDRFPAASLADLGYPNGIIALGGGLDAELTRARGPIAMSESGARAIDALALANQFKDAPLVFTGGSASLLGGGIPESEVAAQLLKKLGLPAPRLRLEPKSRNTSENAIYTRDLLQPKPGERWVLVTSASHMPRAVACFSKAGFHVIPYPVDYFTFGDERDYWNYTFAPLKALNMLDIATKEWIGLIIYWLSGRTNEFFPSPDDT